MRSKLVLGVVTVVVTLAGTGATSATAESPDDPYPPKPGETRVVQSADGPSSKVFARQYVLDKIADRINALIDPTESGRAAKTTAFVNNYSDLTIDPEANQLDIWWKGPVPEAIQSILKAPDDVKVNVHSAKYSLADLNAATDALRASLESGISGTKTSWESITPRGREGQLVVVLAGTSDTARRTDVNASLQASAGVPLKIDWSVDGEG